MITKRSDTQTGKCCSLCDHAVVRPWGARPDDYLVCDVCDAGNRGAPKPIDEKPPDLSDSLWRIATGEKR